MTESSLSAEQIQHYWDQGYINRVPVFSAEEAASYVARIEAAEAAEEAKRGGKWWPRDYRPWEHDGHPLWDLAQELVHHEGILDAVQGILGPEILVRNADVFVKQPMVRRGIGWHQDTAEKGEDADGMLTAWIGLTSSTVENGCLQFSAGSHRIDIPHGPTDKHNLTFKREAVASLDPAATVNNVMEPGMMSMHHFRTAHRSGPNRTKERRIGFVVRFMATRISKDTAESGVACLVRGEDSHRHFMLKPRFPMTWTM